MVIVMLHRYRNPRLWISLSVKRQVKSNLATFHEDECICARRRMFRPRCSENARNAQVTYTRTRLRASHIFSVSSSMLSHNLELIGTDMGIYHSKHTRSVIDSGALFLILVLTLYNKSSSSILIASILFNTYTAGMYFLFCHKRRRVYF